MNQKGTLVEVIDRDRYSRTATMSIGQKKITFPNYFPRVKYREEFESLISTLTLFPLQYVNAYTVRLDDQPNEIFANRASLNQMTMDMKSYANEYVRKFYDETVEIIDPASEYLYYESGYDLLKQLKYLNKKSKKLTNVMAYLDNLENFKNNLPDDQYQRRKKSDYKKFWNDLYKNPSELNKLIGETHDIEIEYGSDILLPFVPVIINESMLDITMSINRISNAISPRDSASYLILNISVLKDDDLMDKIREYLSNDPNKLTVMKIKTMELDKSGYSEQRINYKELMKTMSNITEEDKDKTYILLEGGSQTFPSAVVGFDMVSTTMTGFDRDATSGGFGGYGGYFIPDKLWSIPYDKAMEKFDKNGGVPTCSCPACAEIASLGHRNIGVARWNALRREHFVYQMDDLMRKIVSSIKERKVELLDKFIEKSEVSKLHELIPRM
jgi:hypothetical protein